MQSRIADNTNKTRQTKGQQLLVDYQRSLREVEKKRTEDSKLPDAPKKEAPKK